METLKPAVGPARSRTDSRGTDHWNLTAGVDHNPEPHGVVDVHLRIELENSDVLDAFEGAVEKARSMGSASMRDVKELLSRELVRTRRNTEANLALVEGLLLPLGRIEMLGTDIWNLTSGVDHNPSPQQVVDIHLRIELRDASVLHAFNDAVTEARRIGDKTMPAAKQVLVEELHRTRRDSEENLSLVASLLLP